MAENNQKSNGGQPPKLNLNGTEKGAPTPKAPPPARPPPSTSRIRMDPNAPKKETTRIDLSAAMPIPKGVAPRDEDELKRSTTRIEWNADMTPLSEEERQEVAKKSTIRIDTSEITPIPEGDKNEAAKKSTVRVQIDEERAKGDTARLDAKAIAGAEEAAKKRTARIDLNEVLDESDDIFKRRTALLDATKFAGVTEAPGAPRTIRIKRPETPPTTVLKKAEKVVEEEGQIEAISTEQDSAKKSETARIDLPPEATEQPPTRRKTIRIKRPEGITTSKPLVIGKTENVGEAVDAASAKPAEAEAGVLFSLVALVAVLVGIALVTVQSLTLRSFLQF
jgi:hypothetical protein